MVSLVALCENRFGQEALLEVLLMFVIQAKSKQDTRYLKKMLGYGTFRADIVLSRDVINYCNWNKWDMEYLSQKFM